MCRAGPEVLRAGQGGATAPGSLPAAGIGCGPRSNHAYCPHILARSNAHIPPHTPCRAQLIPGSGAYRYNMWGYSTVGFMAPMARYSAAAAAGGSGEDVLNEFK